jgi:tRNA-dihydrouridine synthase
MSRYSRFLASCFLFNIRSSICICFRVETLENKLLIPSRRFIRHPVARSSDFSTHDNEGPVIAQFASNDPVEFGRAAEMIGPWVNGVDLNCGCPQSWAMKEGIGCSMMANPDKVAAMIKEAKQRIGPGKTVSCKIRIHQDLKYRCRSCFLTSLLTAPTARRSDSSRL